MTGLKQQQETLPVEHRVWRRVHRPEEYVYDVAKFIAREINVPAAIILPLAPIVSAILRNWEDAAVEHTEYVKYRDGTRTLRTIFSINNYSNRAIYGLLEELLQRLGVGRKMRLKQPDIDFIWLILGGVLNDYASFACVSKKSIDALLDFRLRNSDYLTVTTWHTDFVEIANLKTGIVDTLSLPPDDVSCIVSWAVEFQNNLCAKKNIEMDPCGQGCTEFRALMEKYTEIICTSE